MSQDTNKIDRMLKEDKARMEESFEIQQLILKHSRQAYVVAEQAIHGKHIDPKLTSSIEELNKEIGERLEKYKEHPEYQNINTAEEAVSIAGEIPNDGI